MLSGDEVSAHDRQPRRVGRRRSRRASRPGRRRAGRASCRPPSGPARGPSDTVTWPVTVSASSEQDLLALANLERRGEVRGDGRLADAALRVEDRDHRRPALPVAQLRSSRSGSPGPSRRRRSSTGCTSPRPASGSTSAVYGRLKNSSPASARDAPEPSRRGPAATGPSAPGCAGRPRGGARSTRATCRGRSRRRGSRRRRRGGSRGAPRARSGQPIAIASKPAIRSSASDGALLRRREGDDDGRSGHGAGS